MVFLAPLQAPGAEALLVAVQEVALDTVQVREMEEESFLGTAKGEPEGASTLLTLRSTVGVAGQILGPLQIPLVQVSGLVQAFPSLQPFPLLEE